MTLNRSVLRLATAQALAGANAAVVYATGAIIGHQLAPRPSLATLPISIFVVGMALSTLPAGALVRRHGRHRAFLFGNVCGALAGLLAALAIVIGSFALFCTAMLFGGAYAAVVLTFRFAAAECVSKEDAPRALSLVMAGGVAAGVLGPRLVTATMDLWPPHAFAVTYLAAAVVAVLSAFVLAGVRFTARPVAAAAQPETPDDLQAGSQAGSQVGSQVGSQAGPPASRKAGPSLGDILQRRTLVVAMLCGLVSYMMMNFMMTSAPLAMELCGISRVSSNQGLEMHIIAMYGPSFFTGRLIMRFGERAIVQVGLFLIAVAALIGAGDDSVLHFWLALIALGLGWNFGFLGASAMVLKCHTPEEAPRVQSVNDFVVFGSMAVGSFASGGLLSAFGWSTVSLMVLPPVLVAWLALLWQRSAGRLGVSVPPSPRQG